MNVSVRDRNSFVSGTPPTQVAIQAHSTSKSFTIETVNDEEVEDDGLVTVAITAGTGYTAVNPTFASVRVQDNDEVVAPVFLPLVPAPGTASMCKFSFGRAVLAGNNKLAAAPDGSLHRARLAIYGVVLTGPPLLNPDAFCIEVQVSNESTPGAAASRWMTRVYQTQHTLNLSAVSDLVGLDWTAFSRLYQPVAPATSTSPYRHTDPYVCASSCEGGTTQTSFMLLFRKFLKHPTVYAFGTHTVSSGDWSQTLATKTKRQLPPSTGGVNPTSYFGGMGAEIREDLATELANAVVNWVRGLFAGDDDDDE